MIAYEKLCSYLLIRYMSIRRFSFKRFCEFCLTISPTVLNKPDFTGSTTENELFTIRIIVETELTMLFSHVKHDGVNAIVPHRRIRLRCLRGDKRSLRPKYRNNSRWQRPASRWRERHRPARAYMPAFLCSRNKRSLWLNTGTVHAGSVQRHDGVNTIVLYGRTRLYFFWEHTGTSMCDTGINGLSMCHQQGRICDVYPFIKFTRRLTF